MRYGVAALVTVAGIALTSAVLGLTDEPLYAIQVAVVAISLWYGGLGPALLSLGLGWTLTPLLLESDGFSTAAATYRWAIAFVCALAVVWVSLVMRRSEQRAAKAVVDAEQSTRRVETLHDFATALSAAVSPSNVAHVIVERGPRLIGAQGSGLALVDGDALRLVELSGAASMVQLPDRRMPIDAKTLLARSVVEGKTQRAVDRASLAESFPDTAESLPHVQAAMATPLHVAGEVVGAIGFLFERPELASEDAESIATLAAALAGQALERARLYDREHQSRRALDRILRVAPRLYFGTPQEVSDAICREARKTLDADITEIWLIDDDWLWLELVCRDPDDEELVGHDRLEVAQLPGLREAVESLEVTFVRDAEAVLEGELLAYAKRLGIRSWLWAPIVVGERAARVLFFSWTTVTSTPESPTIVLARRFSDQAGLALERVERRQAEERAARRALETRRLLDVTAALAVAATPSEVTDAILREGVRSLGAEGGVVVGRMEGTSDLRLLDSRGYAESDLEPWQIIPLDAPVPVAKAVRDGRLLAIETPEEIEGTHPGLAERVPGPAASWLVVPLNAGGSVIGAAGFAFAEPQTFSEADLEFVEALAGQSGQALERALLLSAEYAARTRAEDMVVVASALSQAATESDVVNAVAGKVLSTVAADFVGVYLVGDDSTLQVVGAVGSAPGADDETVHRLARAEASPPAVAAGSGASLWLETGEDWSDFPDADSWRTAGVGGAAVVPITIDRRVLGILLVTFGVDASIDADTRSLLESLARQAAQPLERTWLMEREHVARVEAEAASTRTRRLQSVTQALAAAPAPRDVAGIVVDEALVAVAADAAALLAFDTERAAPEVLASRGLEDTLLGELTGPVVDALLSRGLILIDANSADGLQESEIRRALAQAGLSSAACIPLGIGNRVLGALVVCFRTRDLIGDEDSALLQTLARIGVQALERSRLFEDELRLRRRTERIQQMTALLAGSLTQHDVAEVVVEALVQAAGADGASLSIVLEERRLQKKLSSRGYSEALQDPLLEIPLDAPTPGNRALRTRELVFYESLETVAADYPEIEDQLRLTEHESFLFVPLVAGGKTNGLLVASWAERVVLTEEERTFVEALASQAAQALDRARHFESERTIAETLQRSVLPASLPRVEGVQLAARYLPGTEEVDVGGDWFDAMALPGGRLGLAVGDVVGKGVQSAATMAQLRNALRAFALDRMKPSATMSRLNRLTHEVSDAAFATVVYVVVDRGSRSCRFTAAGHPPPLLLHPDGRAEFLEGGRGLPLGTGSDVVYEHQSVDLPAGSTLVLYTDGLVERRGTSIDDGLERLRRAVETGPSDPELLVEHVLARLVGRSERDDDIAMLAVRLLAAAPAPLALTLPSDHRSLDLMRDALRFWLEHAPVSQVESHDIVLAAWEACANAIEHPQKKHEDGKSSFKFGAEIRDSCVHVSVHDQGRWLAETDRVDRGLGLKLIHWIMSSVDIDVSEDGTIVRLRKDLARDDVHVA